MVLTVANVERSLGKLGMTSLCDVVLPPPLTAPLINAGGKGGYGIRLYDFIY